jgi:hypothetical protein
MKFFWHNDKNFKCGGLPMKLLEALHIFTPNTPELGRGEFSSSSYPGGASAN